MSLLALTLTRRSPKRKLLLHEEANKNQNNEGEHHQKVHRTHFSNNFAQSTTFLTACQIGLAVCETQHAKLAR
jgi:hypothetical protein